MNNQAELKTSIEIAFIDMHSKEDKGDAGLSKITEKYSKDHSFQVTLRQFYFENLTTDVDSEKIAECDGIILPGAEGEKALNQMRRIARIARVKDIPLLAFGQGMQASVLDIAENVARIKNAGSDQYEQDCSDIFYSAHLTEEAKEQTEFRTINHNLKRQGNYPMMIQENTRLAQIFKVRELTLNHNHQTELNLIWQGPLLDAGLMFSGTSPDGIYIEAVELRKHPFYIAFIAEPFWKYDDFQVKPLYDAFFKAAFDIKNNIKHV